MYIISAATVGLTYICNAHILCFNPKALPHGVKRAPSGKPCVFDRACLSLERPWQYGAELAYIDYQTLKGHIAIPWRPEDPYMRISDSVC